MEIKPIQLFVTRDVTKPVKAVSADEQKQRFLEKGPNGELGYYTRNGGDDVFFTPVSQKRYPDADNVNKQTTSAPISRSGINEKDSFLTMNLIG